MQALDTKDADDRTKDVGLLKIYIDEFSRFFFDVVHRLGDMQRL